MVDISTVPEPSADRLTQTQEVEYRNHREDLIDWMSTIGKNPKRAEGYAPSTVRRRACDTDLFYRFVWEQKSRYSTEVSTDLADEWMHELAREERSDSDRANKQKSIKMLLRFHGIEEWDPEIRFTGGSRQQPPDYLTRDERKRIREAVLDFESVPDYESLDDEKRELWSNRLARRYRIPAEDIGPDEFRRANDSKYPSLVWTSLDAGLRPIEVGRARVSWVDTDNAQLRIPKNQDTKGDPSRGHRQNWNVAIRERTARLLDQWLSEREIYEKYDGTDRLWLTREAEPYSWWPLKLLLHRLCEIADINTEHRKITWYTIRHSTGSYLASDDSLEAARAQLRHSSTSTTQKYNHASVGERRNVLEEMESD
jgi:integrase